MKFDRTAVVGVASGVVFLAAVIGGVAANAAPGDPGTAPAATTAEAAPTAEASTIREAA